MGKIVTLGEIMLRLSTQVGNRLEQTQQLDVHYGGGEANVAISLANFGHQVQFASKVPENALGEAVKKHLQRYGVETKFLLKGGARLGTYYMEAGIGERSAKVTYDRKGSSFAEMTELEWDVENLFKDVDIFHISGITPALSKTWQKLTIDLIKIAKAKGCKISFDTNYRANLWSQKEAGSVVRTILPYVDYWSAGKLDAIHFLGSTETKDKLLIDYYQEIVEKYPSIKVLYSTIRQVESASENTLVGTIWTSSGYFESQRHDIVPIVDRVGAGDAFSAGILHGLLSKFSEQKMIDFATAASALKHTVMGDCNQFSEQEVKDFIVTDSGKIIR